MKFTLSQTDVNGLTDEQQAAIFDALVASILADGKADQAEIGRFEHEVGQIPWGKDATVLMQMVQSSRERITALRTKEEVIGFVDRVAGKLQGQSLREKVFRMMASLAYADRAVGQEESNILNLFQEKFAIPDDRLPEIAAEVKGN